MTPPPTEVEALLKILAATVILALAIGYLLKGRARGLADLHLSMLPILYVALLFGMIPLFRDLSSAVARVLIDAAYLCLVIFLAANVLHHRGWIRGSFAVLTVGWALNAIPIAANGGMPLSLWAYARAGLTEVPTPHRGGFFKIILAGPSTHFNFLGDAIPVKIIGQVISAGDILLVLGIGMLIVAAMRSKSPQTGPVA